MSQAASVTRTPSEALRVPTPRVRATIALASALTIGGLLAWAVVTAWHPVRPHLVCVMPLANGQTAAYFGFANELDTPVTLPVGDDNHFTPGAPDRGQPLVFAARASAGNRERGLPVPVEPGAVRPTGVFAVAFTGRELRWSVDGREAIATPDATRCPMPEPIPVREDVAWVKPKPPEPPPPEPPKPEPPKPEPPKPEEPPPEPPKPAPRVGTTAPRPRADTPPKVTPPEPVPLALPDLNNLSSGIVVQGGDTTALGSPEVEVTKTNTAPQQAGVPDGVPGGTGVEPEVKVVRVPPKVKVRPRGQWPADAPPRAGAVLVKLSLRVGTDGKVREVRVIKGAGAAFDREARRVGLQAEFSPATEAGTPIEQWVPWVVEFSPEEG